MRRPPVRDQQLDGSVAMVNQCVITFGMKWGTSSDLQFDSAFPLLSLCEGLRCFTKCHSTAPVVPVGYAKTPARTPVQVTAVDHVVHRLVVNAVPLDRPVHHWPVSSARPVMSDLPSPLKSPT